MIIALAEKLYTVRCQKNGKYSEIDIAFIYFKQQKINGFSNVHTGRTERCKVFTYSNKHCETLLAQKE